MNKLKLIFFLITLLASQTSYSASNVKPKDTPGYDVVAEYIRSLGAVYNIQQAALKDQQEVDNREDPLRSIMNSIRSSTSFKLELNSSVKMLEHMSVKKKPYDELIPNTIYFYNEKIKLFDETVKISQKIIGATEKDISIVSKMAGRMPEITASIGYIDESIFKSMVLVFALLIDEKPDSEGHMSHLNITKEQRNKLIYNIDASFGDSLTQNKDNWTVASAALLKAYLQKNYICKDDWEHTQSEH